MISNETVFFIAFLIALLSVVTGFAIFLFRMIDSKRDKLDDDIACAYERLSKYILNPILIQIFASERGRFTPTEFFDTPEVIMELEKYRGHLYKFIKVSEMKDSILLMLVLSCKTSIWIAIVIILCIPINGIFINSSYNVVEINSLQMIVLNCIILAIPIIFLAVFMEKFTSINNSFKTQIRELKSGLL